MIDNKQKLFTGASINHDLHNSLSEEIVYMLKGTSSDYSNAEGEYFVGNTRGQLLCYTPKSTIIGVIKMSSPNKFVVFESNNSTFFNVSFINYISTYVN